MISADAALERLVEGNRRYVADKPGLTASTNQDRRQELTTGQEPFAIILGCADSRVPTEVLFDQGLGDLFVVRVAGNIAAPTQIGSIEYAAINCGTRLVVVLGHSSCGAVQATVGALTKPGGDVSENILPVVQRIVPAVEPLLDSELRDQPGDLLRASIRANVQKTVGDLIANSDILAGLARDDGLRIVGAEYSLTTGEVEFFD